MIPLPSDAPQKPPLDGTAVIDMSRVLSGPDCTMALADLGARVIKIERPDIGDDTRKWGPLQTVLKVHSETTRLSIKRMAAMSSSVSDVWT
jgi:crotonobetainyl-CoA:carnitine CoA-transferase CaiB-like acyl-CoA transferase